MTNQIKHLPVVLHVGYHKTATTYLQQLVFPEQSQLLYPGRPFKTREISDFFLLNQFTHPLFFDIELLREKFYSVISNWMSASGENADSKKALLVSHESLHSGPEWFGADVCMMADRLKAIFPSAKIIIGIRNQRDYIESNYKQYVILGGKLSYHDFISDSYAFTYGLVPKLNYEKLISYYFNLFGKDNVHVYMLEDFKHDLVVELNGIMRFMGLEPMRSYKTDKVNAGLSEWASVFIRRMNSILASDFNEQYHNWMNHRMSLREKFRWKVVRLIKKAEAVNLLRLNKKLTDEKTNQQFNNMFRDSNRKLSLLLNKDLSKLGYYH